MTLLARDVATVRVGLELDRAVAAVAVRLGWEGPPSDRPVDVLVSLASDAVAVVTGAHAYDAAGTLSFVGGRLGSSAGFSRISGTCEPLEGPFARAVRFAVQPALLRAGVLLVHGATVMRDGRALLLAGPSGIGKSTLARRFETAGWDVLGDEVAMVDAAGQAWGFPLQPRHCGSPGPASLEAVHLLSREQIPSRTALRAAAVSSELLRYAMVYEASADAARRAHEISAALATRVKGYRTSVPDAASAVRWVLEGRD